MMELLCFKIEVKIEDISNAIRDLGGREIWERYPTSGSSKLLSAVTDSNRMLRDEKDQFEKENNNIANFTGKHISPPHFFLEKI